jgi:hypothetical protein
MTHIVGSATSLIDGIRIDDNIPLPPKHSQVKRQREPESQQPVVSKPALQAAPEKEQSRLTMRHLQWRVSVARYQRNERIL